MAAFQFIFLVLWLVAVSYYILSAYCLSSFLKKKKSVPAPADAGLPPLTLMKPVKGIGPHSRVDFLSFINQDYPRFQVLFGLMDEDDPARPLIEELIARNPGKDIELVVSGEETGENRKVSNLHNMSRKAKYDILVIADSDMRVGPDYLRAVAAGFDRPSVGLVTCPYRGSWPENFGAALEALTINAEFLPSVTVAERLEGLSFALGATMAVRRGALGAIGGFPALADYLADDYQLGNKVKAAGYGIKLSGYIVDSVQGRESFAGYFSHQLRWGRTYRACRPVSYFFSVLTKGTPFSLLFLAASGFGRAGWLVVLAELAVRQAQARYMERALVKSAGTSGYYWLLPLRDLLGFAVWAMSFAGGNVRWKGTSFRVLSDGKMKKLLTALFFLAAFSIQAGQLFAAGVPAKYDPELSAYENALAHGDYSTGIQVGYGTKIWDGALASLDTALATVSVKFPISGVKARGTILRGVWEYKVEALGGIITSENDKGVVGLSPVGFRYDFTGLGAFSPYVELMVGAVYLNVPHTIQGTRFNFIEHGAIGAQYFVSDKTSLDLQARLQHLSNAGIKEPNHGLNSGYVLFGVTRYW